MKKLLLLGVLVTVGLSSCTQEESVIEPTPETTKNYVETFVNTDMLAAGYKSIEIVSPASSEVTTRGTITPVLFNYNTEETKAENGRAIRALDGDLSTYWHTNYSEGIIGMPAWISVGLDGGRTKSVRGFQIYHRWGAKDARPTKMEVQYRNYGTIWSTLTYWEPGAVKETKVFNIRTDVDTAAWAFATPFKANEVKFIFTDANGKPYTYIAEIHLYE